MPASIQAELPGHGAGLPGLAGERAAADPGGAGHGLHRAGRALRELHPPDHDSLDAALGGRGRAAGADALPARFQRHRAHRHHPADRHREEERHHDDRLRARGRAQTRASRRGGHLPGLPAALPADHDDHHGGAAGRLPLALGTGVGSELRRPAGHRHRRRPDLQPGADALHHAGDLLWPSTGWRAVSARGAAAPKPGGSPAPDGGAGGA
jgi:hypothetical protein